MSATVVDTPVLEPAAQAFADSTDNPPFIHQVGPAAARKVLDDVQSGEIAQPAVDETWVKVPGGPVGDVDVWIVRPAGATGELPVIVYTHGAGWVLGNAHTHGRLVRELAVGTGAAVVFPEYTRSPEARYPQAIEECWTAASWVATGEGEGLDGSRMTVAGDSCGGDLAIALTLLAKQRGGIAFRGQVLFYPVTDANFETGSYLQFAEGYFLRRDAMQWFWDQYAPDEEQRDEITASPLRASLDELAGLPRALVINGEADVLRDEGQAYASKLRQAGVPVTSVRYQGMIHDFVMLNALRETQAADAAIKQATQFLRDALDAHKES